MNNYFGFFLIFILVTLTSVCNCTQQCKKIPPKIHLDLERMEGAWYVMATGTYSPTPPTKCASATKTYVNNTLVINQVNYNNADGPFYPGWNGVITETSSGALTFDISYPKDVTWTYFRMLDTNYATYDIVYACSDLNGVYKGTVVLMLSRFCHFNEGVYKEATGKLASMGETGPWLKFGGPECCTSSSSS